MTLENILSSLRAGLHALFFLLLGFGVARAWSADTLTVLACCIAAMLAAFYALGAFKGIPTRRAGAWWLAGNTVLWLGLMVHGQDFMWLEFPLVFVALRYLPRVPGLITVAALWAAAAFIPAWRYPDTWTVATAVGPAIGTACAIAAYFAYEALRAEAVRYRQLAARLQETQASLAASERRAGQLEERARLSREIHDTVAQSLSSIVLLSRAAQNASKPAGHIMTIQQSAKEALGQARRLVQDLAEPDAAPAVPHTAVVKDLRTLIGGHQGRAHALGEDTTFELVVNADAPVDLPQPVATAVERTAREGLNNVARHAQAGRAVVTLGVFPDRVTLDVADDGRGIAQPEGFGLRGLRTRVAEAGGELDVASTPGEGTTLTATFGLNNGSNNGGSSVDSAGRA